MRHLGGSYVVSVKCRGAVFFLGVPAGEGGKEERTGGRMDGWVKEWIGMLDLSKQMGLAPVVYTPLPLSRCTHHSTPESSCLVVTEEGCGNARCLQIV